MTTGPPGGAERLEEHLRPAVRLHHDQGEVFRDREVDEARLQDRGHLRGRGGAHRHLLSIGGTS